MSAERLSQAIKRLRKSYNVPYVGAGSRLRELYMVPHPIPTGGIHDSFDVSDLRDTITRQCQIVDTVPRMISKKLSGRVVDVEPRSSSDKYSVEDALRFLSLLPYDPILEQQQIEHSPEKVAIMSMKPLLVTTVEMLSTRASERSAGPVDLHTFTCSLLVIHAVLLRGLSVQAPRLLLPVLQGRSASGVPNNYPTAQSPTKRSEAQTFPSALWPLLDAICKSIECRAVVSALKKASSESLDLLVASLVAVMDSAAASWLGRSICPTSLDVRYAVFITSCHGLLLHLLALFVQSNPSFVARRHFQSLGEDRFKLLESAAVILLHVGLRVLSTSPGGDVDALVIEPSRLCLNGLRLCIVPEDASVSERSRSLSWARAVIRACRWSAWPWASRFIDDVAAALWCSWVQLSENATVDQHWSTQLIVKDLAEAAFEEPGPFPRATILSLAYLDPNYAYKQLLSREKIAAIQEPDKPSDGACCGAGCDPCVWDLYDDAVASYEERQQKNLQICSNVAPSYGLLALSSNCVLLPSLVAVPIRSISQQAARRHFTEHMKQIKKGTAASVCRSVRLLFFRRPPETRPRRSQVQVAVLDLGVSQDVLSQDVTRLACSINHLVKFRSVTNVPWLLAQLEYTLSSLRMYLQVQVMGKWHSPSAVSLLCNCAELCRVAVNLVCSLLLPILKNVRSSRFCMVRSPHFKRLMVCFSLFLSVSRLHESLDMAIDLAGYPSTDYVLYGLRSVSEAFLQLDSTMFCVRTCVERIPFFRRNRYFVHLSARLASRIPDYLFRFGPHEAEQRCPKIFQLFFDANCMSAGTQDIFWKKAQFAFYDTVIRAWIVPFIEHSLLLTPVASFSGGTADALGLQGHYDALELCASVAGPHRYQRIVFVPVDPDRLAKSASTS